MSEEGVSLRFRNYVPKDIHLRTFCLPRPSVDELEVQIQQQAQQAIQAAKEEDILSQVVPRRPNWDLKRDVERKITILSRRTDKAIIQLIKEKIEENKKNKDNIDNNYYNNDKDNQEKGEKEQEGEEGEEGEGEEKQLSREEIERRQTVLNGMDEFDKIDDDDDD